MSVRMTEYRELIGLRELEGEKKLSRHDKKKKTRFYDLKYDTLGVHCVIMQEG